jgi:hypothetical protein
MHDTVIAMMIGIFLLLFALQSLRGKKQFGKDIAKITEMTLDLLLNIYKGIYRFLRIQLPKLYVWLKSLI